MLSEGERLLSGWTLFAPEELNTKVGDKFEEKVLLLVRVIVQCGRRSADALSRVSKLSILLSAAITTMRMHAH